MAFHELGHIQLDGGVFAAFTKKQMKHLEAQKQLWERYGHTQLEIMDAKRIREVVKTENYIGGMLDMSGGSKGALFMADKTLGKRGKS